MNVVTNSCACIYPTIGVMNTEGYISTELPFTSNTPRLPYLFLNALHITL